MNFQDKDDSFVGTGGSQMSGGQNQRIAIARAFAEETYTAAAFWWDLFCSRYKWWKEDFRTPRKFRILQHNQHNSSRGDLKSFWYCL